MILVYNSQMSNKSYLKQNYSHRRTSAPTPFSLELTNSQELKVTPLTYSNSNQSSQQLPTPDSTNPPSTTAFTPFSSANALNLPQKDRLDRKFQAIKRLHNSTSQMREVSPSRIDIVLQQGIAPRVPPICIHSSMLQPKRLSPPKNQLKEFKEIQGMRQALKSRNFTNSKHLKLMVHAMRSSQSAQQNPQQRASGVWSRAEARARTSRMYSQRQKRIKESHNQEDHMVNSAFLKDICSARSLRYKKANGQA